MPIIALFSGRFCNEEPFLKKLLARTSYKLISDKDLVLTASKISSIPPDRIERAFSAKISLFNKFTHEKERATAYLRLALAQILSRNNLLIAGFMTQLVSRKINTVLRVCLIADMKSRVSIAAKDSGLSAKEATKIIHKQQFPFAAVLI